MIRHLIIAVFCGIGWIGKSDALKGRKLRLNNGSVFDNNNNSDMIHLRLERHRPLGEGFDVLDAVDKLYKALDSPIFLSMGAKSVNLSSDDVKLIDQVIPERKLATYYGTVTVGENPSTTFKVLFDSGSCEFWLPDQSCISNQCRRHTRYKRSTSFAPLLTDTNAASFLEVEYLSGRLSGYDGYETVKIGPVTVPHTNVGFATELEIPLLKDLHWDGIVGLGFANNEITKRKVTPFFDHIVESKALTNMGKKNLFAYYINENGGYLTFGGINHSLKKNIKDDFKWASVNPSNSYWTIKILGIRKEYPDDSPKSEEDGTNNSKAFHDGGRDSIVDTGTYLIYAPPATMRNYLRDVRVRSCADKTHLPNLIFQISETLNNSEPNFFELLLTPGDYVLEFDEGEKKICSLGIAPDDAEDQDGLGGWTLGQVFLRSHYTIFDRDNLRVGFARSKDSSQ